MYTKFWVAMGLYAVLAVAATFTLDGKLRTAIWVLMGGLALKTLIAYKARQIEKSEKEIEPPINADKR